MRKQYNRILKIFFHEKIRSRRKVLGISQEEMAHRLAMSYRGYAKIDNGHICGSALTLSLYLIYICENPVVFLQELRYAFENSNFEAA